MKLLCLSGKIFLYFALLLFGVGGFFFTLVLPQPAGFQAFILTLALGGLGVATNIYVTKKNKQHLVCPTGSDCNVVVTSRYSKFFGIPLEYLGMLYFSLVALSYSILLFAPQILSGAMISAIMLLTMGAFFFSCYLLFVQSILLRQWCIWCILASMFSMTIFFISLVGLEPAISLLATMQPVILMLRSFGFVLGMGGSTAAAFLFFTFLEDRKLNDNEINAWKGVSEMIWVGIALTLMSQFALYVTDPTALGQSGAFLVQMISLFMVALSGATLMIIFAPLLAIVPFKQEETSSPLAKFRRPTFIAGALALSSWFVAFFMTYIANYTFLSLFVAYLLTLSLAIVLSLLLEKRVISQ
ncbi:MAG: vitamin K epoxide reductase family protein [bacterium]|nr:vitamin K epoxide reductase family protein [bacterium]